MRGGMTFGEVLEGLNAGKWYEREAWDQVGMFIFKPNGAPRISVATREGHTSTWLISHADVFAIDWRNVLEKELIIG